MSGPRRRGRRSLDDAGGRSRAGVAFSASARGARPGGALLEQSLHHAAFSGRRPSPDPDAVVFRLLCPSDRVDALLGADGDALRRLRDETGANISLLDPEDDTERTVRLSSAEDGVSPLCPAQVALFRAYARLAGDPPSVPFRLLVPQHHTACLLDRDGAVDARIRENTGARVRLLPRDASAHATRRRNTRACDDVVEIAGSPALACSAAIRAVSSRLRAVAADRDAAAGPTASPPAPASASEAATNPASGFHPTLPPELRPAPAAETEDVVVHLPIPVARIGGVIGRGGTNIQRVRSASGARVKLHDAAPRAASRLLELSGPRARVAEARRMVEEIAREVETASTGRMTSGDAAAGI